MSQKTIKRVLELLLVIIAVWGAVKYILPLTLPFLFAWLIAFCLQPALRLLSKRFGGKKRLLAGIFVTLTVGGVGMLAFLFVNRIVNEAGSFVYELMEGSNGGLDGFFSKFNAFVEHTPLLSAYGKAITEALESAIIETVRSFTAELPHFIADLLNALPKFVIFTVVLIMASYYFAADFEGLSSKLYELLPESARRFTDKLKTRLISTGLSYLKACLLLAFITFAELTVGFLTLGIPYAFTLALLIALVDMLPILGAGTVLLPWAFYEWVTGDAYYAIGLIIIWAVVSVIRRFAEPRIISSGIGLSPITTLFSMYVGFRIFGIGGLFFAPLVCVFVLNALPDTVSEKLGLYTEKASRFDNQQSVNNPKERKIN